MSKITRLTDADIESLIAEEQYHVFPGTTVTVCCLTLKNGFAVVGESACVSRENFDEQVGRRIAFDNARNFLWQLEGYSMKSRLHAEKCDSAARVPHSDGASGE